MLLLLLSPRARQLWLPVLILVGSVLWTRELVRFGNTQSNIVFALTACVALAARWAAAAIWRAVESRLLSVHGGSLWPPLRLHLRGDLPARRRQAQQRRETLTTEVLVDFAMLILPFRGVRGAHRFQSPVREASVKRLIKADSRWRGCCRAVSKQAGRHG